MEVENQKSGLRSSPHFLPSHLSLILPPPSPFQLQMLFYSDSLSVNNSCCPCAHGGGTIYWILASFPRPASLQKPDCLSLESPTICPQHPHATSPSPRWDFVWSDLTQVVLTYCCCCSCWQPLCCVQKTMLPYRYLQSLVLVFLPPLSRGSLSLWRKECDTDFPFRAGRSAVSCNLTSCGPPCELPSTAARSFSERDKILSRICFLIVIKVSEC